MNQQSLEVNLSLNKALTCGIRGLCEVKPSANEGKGPLFLPEMLD